MHKLRHPSDPTAIRGLICAALAAEQGAPLMHRLDCVLLVALGRSPEEVAAWFGVGKRSVQRWMHDVDVSGIGGLVKHRHKGRLPSLTLDQAQGTCRDLTSPPSSFGYPDLRWTGKRLALHLHGCYGIAISVRTSQRIIARSRCAEAAAPH